MKKPKPYELPPLDEEAFALAVEALRAAVQHDRRVDLSCEGRKEALQKADEFSALRRRHENQIYCAGKLKEFAVDILKAAAVRGRPHPESCYGGGGVFDKYGSGVELRRAVEKVRAAYRAVDRT